MDTLIFVYHHFIGLFSDSTVLLTSTFVISILIELPYTLLILLGTWHHFLIAPFTFSKREAYFPKVSCVVTCYNEGKDVLITIDTLLEQIYDGSIEILVLVDGATVNIETYKIIQKHIEEYKNRNHPKGGLVKYNKVIKLIPKWERGGHASSTNLGFKMSTGDLVIPLDGDCSVDNDMVDRMVQQFINKNVIASSGTLRVRNINDSVISRMQGLEYMIGIHMSRTALAKYNAVNNISGAFGCFRKRFMEKSSLWRNGSAEDLDMTLRLQFLFKRHKNIRITHAPDSIVHTDAPNTIWGFIKQRMRWEGDIIFVYFRRHRRKLLPKYLGWKNWFFVIFSGVLLHGIQPLLITFGVIYSLMVLPITILIPVYVAVYLFYLIVMIVNYTTYMLIVSNRKKEDIKLWWIVPLMPLYSVFSKFVASVALLCELFLQTHKDSSMAPIWINKKVK